MTSWHIKKSGKIIAFGDSLTEGYGLPSTDSYPAILERKLHADGYEWSVSNKGISGELTFGGLSRTDEIIKEKPDIVILELGANDSFRSVDPKQIKDNLKQIIDKLQEQDIVVIIAGMRMMLQNGPQYAVQFAQIYRDLAAEKNIILIPDFLKGVQGDQRLNISDGIHPNKEGYQIIVDNIYPEVIKAMKRVK